MTAQFTRKNLPQLIKSGYTHIHCKGMNAKGEYELVPLKADDNRVNDPKLYIEDIQGNEIAEMATGAGDINFII